MCNVSLQAALNDVEQLLKIVNDVEDESLKAVRSLESSISTIEHEIQDFYNQDNITTDDQQTPEDLLKIYRAVTDVTSKAIAASSSRNPEDVIAVATSGRLVVSELLSTTKVISISCPIDCKDLYFRTFYHQLKTMASKKKLMSRHWTWPLISNIY